MRLRTLAILVTFAFLTQGCTYYFGNSWAKKAPAYRNSDPMPFSTELRERMFETNYKKHPLINEFAEKDIQSWSIKAKSGTPRVMLAKLAVGNNVQRVNEFLLISKPWGVSGSTSPFFKKGDYDFTQIMLCNILYLFGEDKTKLWPQTREHLLNVLIIEEGGKSKLKTPRTLKIMKDTENHILMTEITRYLKNQWLKNNGSAEKKHDNERNGLEKWFREHLKEMLKTGMYEFNARPYMGYTLSALLTLHAFAESDELVHLCQKILDHVNYAYAITSDDYRRNVPFRRRLERVGNTDIYNDAHSAMMKAWVRKQKSLAVSGEDIDYGKHQTLMALILPYQIPKKVAEICLDRKQKEYLVRIGHGHKASPEIHSVGKNFILSAGGVQRGKVSQIVARPTVLILDDRETDYKSCFHLTGKGKMRNWNNTGVYHRFACSNAPVTIPEKYAIEANKMGWAVYQPFLNKDFYLGVYNQKKLGLLLVFPSWPNGKQDLLSQLQALNKDEKQLKRKVVFPDGMKITFDVNSGKRKWVIKEVNNITSDRFFDDWPRLSKKNF